MGLPFCVLFLSNWEDEDLYNWVFMREEFAKYPVRGGTTALFSASLL